ncbi:MAG: catalase [Burkholderiales bacterium]|nr:MAG: catalase [Burkholderiales bacterium]TAG82644.1 MAG: catalase [Betaproteobacteria bacterium]
MGSVRSANKKSLLAGTAMFEARGKGGEIHQRAGAKSAALTTGEGTRISDNQNTLRAAPRGASLISDMVFLDKLSHFDRERIPERVVHARGAVAKGYFQCTHSLAKYTTARVLSVKGQKTPVIARLSTVAGGRGSADTVRDTRGFAVKFYTDQGNWDLVGNNIPVFFIQDAMKFPDLVHAVKQEPDRGFPSAASAHDTFWDFVSLMPETMHHLLWVMSDRGIPRSLRTMEGFGVHTYRLVNAKGESHFVKFHWRPQAGLQCLIWDEAVKIAGADPDFHRRDLWECIDGGSEVRYDLFVQTLTQKQADALPFDVLDPTKLIPEEDFPLQPVGTMVLNENPSNFFAENEQLAFSPMHIVPGIDFSNDPLLQGRLFSYNDTQMHRLGGPNFAQLEVNRPRCPVANFQRDGFAQHAKHAGRVAYEPNLLDPSGPREAADGLMYAPHPGADTESGPAGRVRAESFADHFTQARQFFKSQTALQQSHIVAALAFELSKVQATEIRQRVLAQLGNVDSDLAARVAKGLGLKAAPPPAPAAKTPRSVAPSAALQTESKDALQAGGRAVAILIDTNTDAKQLNSLKAKLSAAGVKVKLIAPSVHGIKLHDGTEAAVDGQLDGNPSCLFDAVALVLAADAAKALAKNACAVDFVRDAFGHLKAIAASQGAETLLTVAGVATDTHIVNATDAKSFVALVASRAWAREPKVRPQL